MEPTVGRIVHYQSYGTPGGEFLPTPTAALIVEVNAQGTHESYGLGLATLAVFYPNGISFKQTISYADAPTPGCWNWPPRVG